MYPTRAGRPLARGRRERPRAGPSPSPGDGVSHPTEARVPGRPTSKDRRSRRSRNGRRRRIGHHCGAATRRCSGRGDRCRCPGSIGNAVSSHSSSSPTCRRAAYRYARSA
jgi:hypothetical protein